MPKTLAQIQKQIARLEEQANAIKQREVAGVIARIREAISFYKLTPADLALAAPAAGAKPRKTRKPRSAPAGKKAATTVKYRGEAGQTWSGRGRRPTWFNEALAAGKTAEQLAA